MEKNTNSCLSRFLRNFNTFNYTKRATEQTDTDRVDDVYTSAVSPGTRSLLPKLAWFDSATGRIPPTILYCWWWCLLSLSGSLLSFSLRPLSHGPLHH